MKYKILLLFAIVILVSGCTFDGHGCECPKPGPWSDCNNGTRYRTTYSCSSGGECTSSTESRNCNMPVVGYIDRYYEWSYGNNIWVWETQFPVQLYEYYKNRERLPTIDYTFYATDPGDDELISNLLNVFEIAADENNYNDWEKVNLVISFVQGLSYTSDNVTTGFDDYPRYPLETLVDNGGDCEDTAILATALLYDMGYDAVLLVFRNHTAVGVRCEEGVGDHYVDVYGKIYCYLETTGANWKIGEMPEEYRGEVPKIRYIVPKPFFDINWSTRLVEFGKNITYMINVSLMNIGSAKSENTKIWVAFDDTNETVFDQKTSDGFDLDIERAVTRSFTLDVPVNSHTRLHVAVWADNAQMQNFYSTWVDLVPS